jgi:hypothetical protein
MIRARVHGVEILQRPDQIAPEGAADATARNRDSPYALMYSSIKHKVKKQIKNLNLLF